MKKIAISDFDGTMYPYNASSKIIPAINIEAIDRWRAAGNIFAFCTGRNLLSMLVEIKRNNISYDYLICNSGAVIVDNQGKVLLEKNIAPELLKEVMKFFDFSKCIEIMLSTMDKLEAVIVDEENSKLLKYFKDDSYKIFDLVIRYDKIEDFGLEDVTQFSVAMHDVKQTEACVKRLEEEFADKLQINYNLSYIDICAAGVNKVSGINNLLSLVPECKGAEVITIGDAHNDVEMLSAFKGYSLDNATPEARAVALATFPNVGSMLLKELNE